MPAPERRVTVEVLNGTARQGLARIATRVLRRRGLDVVFLGNADTARGFDPGRRAPGRSGTGQGRRARRWERDRWWSSRTRSVGWT